MSPEWDLKDTKGDATEEDTAKRPDIAGHLNNNKDYKIVPGQVSHSFLTKDQDALKMNNPLKSDQCSE